MKTNAIKIIKPLTQYLHTILIAFLPILVFYNTNKNELQLGVIIDLLIFPLAIAIILVVGILPLKTDHIKRSLFATLLIFVFFTYGHLSNLLSEYLYFEVTKNFVIGPNKILIPFLIILLPYTLFHLYKTKRNLLILSRRLSFVFLLLVFIQLLQILLHEYNTLNIKKASINEMKATSVGNAKLPNIYYVILDGYARNDVLEQIYGYDNSKFMNYLEQKGFYVTSKSRSNYSYTFLSLASSLSMQYLDYFHSDRYKNTNDKKIPRNMISYSDVADTLRDFGYTIINVGSVWDPTGRNFDSDLRIVDKSNVTILGKDISLSELNIVFLKTTLLSPFINEVFEDMLREHVLFQFDQLANVSNIDALKFVLVHINSPHPPYIFDKKGNLTHDSKLDISGNTLKDRERYVNQLIYITNKTMDAINQLQNNSINPPIIILQSDHGPASILLHEDWSTNDKKEDMVYERTSILNAYLFPDKQYQQLYNDISPVNTFRIIFQQYLDLPIELLEDKIYFSASLDNPYNFEDVTEITNKR